MIKQITHITLCVLFLLALAAETQAQILLNLRYASSGVTHIRDLSSFSISNSSGTNFQCIIQIEISSDDITVAKGESGIMLLSPGELNMQKSDPGLFQIRRSSNPGADFIRNDGTLKPGNYYVCVKILDSQNRSEITFNCEGFFVNNASQNPQNGNGTAPKNEDGKKKFPVQFSGNAELSGYFANRPPMFSEYQANYGHVFLNPTLTVYDVPLSGTVLISSQNSPMRQNMNVFNFSFDTETFKNNLIKRLTKAVAENKKLNELTGGKMKTLGKLDNLNKLMENPEVMKELQGIEELDKYRNQLDGVESMKQGYENMNVKDLEIINLNETDYNKWLSQAEDSLKRNDTLAADTAKLKQRYDSLKTKSDSLRTVYDNYKTKYDSLKTVSDSLMSKIDGLKHLDFKKGGYQALLNQKEGLIKDAKINGWVDSLGNVKDAAGNVSTADMSKISDMNYLTGKLSGMGLLKKYEKYLGWIKKFSIGTSFTRYSEYTLNNLPVSGFSIEVAPADVYLAVTYGRVQRPVFSPEPENASYKRNLLSASVGYGAPGKNNFRLNFLSVKDDPNSINPKDSIFYYQRKPQDNKVLSVSFDLNFLKSRLKFSGELAGSQLVRDLTFPEYSGVIQLQDTAFRSEKEWFSNIFRQQPVNLYTVTDFAYFAKAEAFLFKNTTMITFGTSRVGENFHSSGTPFLMKNLNTFEGKISQKLLKNKITLTAFIRQMSNNLSGNLPLTVSQWRWGADLTVNIPKIPVIRVMYIPILQQNDSGTVNMNMLSSNLTYQLKIKKTRLMNMASYIFQNGTRGFTAEAFSAHFVTFNQNIIFPKGQNLSWTLNYMYTLNNIEKLHSLSGTLSAGGTLFKKWINAGGTTVYINALEQRYMLFYRTGISFLKYFSLNVQFEGQIYRNIRPDALYNRYDVFAVRPLINIRW